MHFPCDEVYRRMEIGWEKVMLLMFISSIHVTLFRMHVDVQLQKKNLILQYT